LVRTIVFELCGFKAQAKVTLQFLKIEPKWLAKNKILFN